jgi:hypothetical protein
MEARLFAEAVEEWSAVVETVAMRRPALQQMIASYHRRRVRAAPDLVRMMHRPAPTI